MVLTHVTDLEVGIPSIPPDTTNGLCTQMMALINNTFPLNTSLKIKKVQITYIDVATTFDFRICNSHSREILKINGKCTHLWINYFFVSKYRQRHVSCCARKMAHLINNTFPLNTFRKKKTRTTMLYKSRICWLQITMRPIANSVESSFRKNA